MADLHHRRQSESGSNRSISDSSSNSDFYHARSNTSRSRQNSRTGSAFSRSRSRSRPSSLPDINRVASGRYIDDQSAYYTEYNPTRSSSDVPDREASGNEKDIEETVSEEHGGGDVDPETGQPQLNLEKSRTRKSERSQHDPKLV